VQEQFTENFPETSVPHCSAVRRLTGKFCETGSVLDAECSGRPSKLNNKKLMDISDCVLRSASKLLCRLVQEKDIGLATAHEAAQEKLLFLYKVTVVEELKPGD
jgi:transposase